MMTRFLNKIADRFCAVLCFRRKRVDILVWMQESSFSEAVNAQIAKAKPSSIVIGLSYFSGSSYAYRGAALGLPPRPFLLNAVIAIGRRLGYRLAPLTWLISGPMFFLFYLYLGLRFRVHSVLVMDHWVAANVGFLRRIGVFRRLVFLSGDWYPGNTLRTGMWSRIGNEVFFPIVDWLACKLSDLTINQTEAIANARTQYWGKRIPREEVGLVWPLIAKCKDIPRRRSAHNILFQGVTRPDSGIDVILKALPLVRERLGVDVVVRIVGLVNPAVEELQASARACGSPDLLECTGLVDYADFGALCADCYCGVNLITDPNSFSAKAIPGKILDYFQQLLPSLVSPYVGAIADTIRDRELGLVVEPTVDATAAALIELHEKRAVYVQNIQSYLETRSSTNLVELLCPERAGARQ